MLKKKDEQVIEQQQDVLEDTILNDNISIYSMPERFRSSYIKVGQAKKTGIIIIVVGIIFLIIISILFYYLFFNNKKNKLAQVPVAITTTITEPIVKKQDKMIATSTSLSDENLIATSSATPILIATSTTISTDIINQVVSWSPGIDSDNDGLTNEEEKIFGSDFSISDSDKDGYNDLAEILNNYNPSGNGLLSTNSGLLIYNNKNYKYSLLYPSIWKNNISGDDDSIILKADDGSFIQIITQENKKQEEISEWYKQQFNLIDIDQNKIIVNNSWQGIINSDGLTIYLTDLEKKYIFILAYNPAGSNMLNYSNLFKAMIKSFKII